MGDNDKEMNCITYIEKTLRPHVGKFGIILSVLGGCSSILLGFGLTNFASVVMGITNVAIFCGSLAFERLKYENNKLNSDCESQRQVLRRLTLHPQFRTFNDEDDTETPKSINSIQPVDFGAIHRNAYGLNRTIYEPINETISVITPNAFNSIESDG